MQDQTTPPVERRSFLKLMGAFFLTIWGVMAVSPVFRYLSSGAEKEEKSTVSSVTVGKVAEVPVGSGKNFKFGSTPAILIHTEDGQFHAFKAVCTHLGCTVQYNSGKEKIWCACHGGQYNPATGKNEAGPPPKPLDALKVEVVNDNIVVSRA